MKHQYDFNCDAYKALFNWTKPQFDEEKLCWFQAAGNDYGFFELNWVEGGGYVVIIDGIEKSAEETRDEALMYCFSYFQGQLLCGIAVMMEINITHGKCHEKGEWNKQNIRSFCLDQSLGEFDAFDENNFSVLLDNLRERNYTDTNDEDDVPEQAGHFQVEEVKPTIH